MSKQIESNPSRVSFDPSGVDMESVDKLADDRNQSRAELIRTALADELQQTGLSDDHDLDSTLADALRALKRVAVNGQVSTEEAESAIAQEIQIPSSATRRILRQLDNEDMIKPAWGVVKITEEARD